MTHIETLEFMDTLHDLWPAMEQNDEMASVIGDMVKNVELDRAKKFAREFKTSAAGQYATFNAHKFKMFLREGRVKDATSKQANPEKCFDKLFLLYKGGACGPLNPGYYVKINIMPEHQGERYRAAERFRDRWPKRHACCTKDCSCLGGEWEICDCTETEMVFKRAEIRGMVAKDEPVDPF